MAMTPVFGRRRRGPERLPWRGEDRLGRPLTIRVVVANDGLEYLAHMQRIVSETHYMLQCDYDPLPSVEGQRRLLAQLEHSDNSLGLVAYRANAARSGRVVGSLTLLGGRSSRTRHCCSLGMGVDKADWRKEVGSLLPDAAISWAKRNIVVTRIGLQLFEDNAAARSLYLARNFVDEGLMQREVLVTGRYFPLLGMALDVSSESSA